VGKVIVERNAAYEGSIPAIYDEYLGPALFEPYAVLVASEFASTCGTSVLETACGTGIFTKHLRKRVPSSVEIVATDLNPGMLEFARHAQNNAGVRWQEANAMSLPFSDKTFSAVFCMFGIMFVPDKAVAFAEAARVLQPGGIFGFSVWDGLSGSPAAAAADQLLRETFPSNPPTYYEVPYGFNDRVKIQSMLESAGFSGIRIEAHTLPSQSPSALALANGIIRGSPVAVALEQRQADAEPIVSALGERLAAFAGVAPCMSTTRALIVSARRAAAYHLG